MNKKDFGNIAEIIKNSRCNFKEDLHEFDLFIVADLCEYLKTTNKDFKEKEFKALCGLGVE